MKSILQLLSIILLLMGGTSFAQNTTSISAGNWNTAGNWSNGVPGVGGNVTVNHSMTLDGDISRNSGIFIVSDAGQIIDPAGGADYEFAFNNGSIGEVSGTVSVGGDFRVRNTSQFVLKGCDTMTVGGNVLFAQSASVTVESCAVLYIDGDMDMQNSGATTINGNVIVGGNLGIKNTASISGTGSLQVDGTTDIKNTATIFGSTTECNDCIYGPGGALPIELLSFTASPLSETEIEINWETLSEINNDYFTLEYTLDGENFINIANLQGAGNSTSIKKYRHIFEHDLSDVIYLRLTQTDFDGKFESFDLIGLDLKETGAEQYQRLGILAYPNPAINGKVNLSINVSGIAEGKGSVMIHNINGSLVFQKEYSYEQLIRRIEIFDKNVQNLEKGIYYISVINGNEKNTEKFVVI